MQSGNTQRDSAATDLQNLDTNLGALTRLEANVGARHRPAERSPPSRIQHASDQRHSGAVQRPGRRHGDRPRSTSRPSRPRTTAALHAGANIVQTSLLNFLQLSPDKGEPVSLTIDSSRFGRVEIDPGVDHRVPRRPDRPDRLALRAARARPRHAVPVAAVARGPGARAAGDQPAPVLLATSRSRSPTRTPSGWALDDLEREVDVYVTVRAAEALEDFIANLQGADPGPLRSRLSGHQPGARRASCARRCSPRSRSRPTAASNPAC